MNGEREGGLEAEIRTLGDDAASPLQAGAVKSLEARGAAAVPGLLAELAFDRLGGVGRARILTLLARAGAPEAVPAVLAGADDRRNIVRAAAIDALAAFDDERAVATLVRLLGDADTDVVKQAAARLGDRREAAAVPRLGDLLFRPEQGVRFVAARALARVGTPDARGWLRAGLARESDDEVRAVIEAAL